MKFPNTKPFFLAMGLMLSCGPVKPSGSSSVQNTPGEDPNVALLLGQGYNSVNNTVKGHCVELGLLQTQSGQITGSNAEYRLLEITSEKSLRENLNVSASASIKGGLFGGGSGRFSFVSSVNKNSASRYVLVHARVSNQMALASSFTFKNNAASLLKQGNQKAFFDQCGNEFVHGRRTGGEFYALFEYEFSSSEEEKKFSAAIKASGAGWKASSEVSSEMAKFSMSAKVQVKMLRLGGNGALPEVSDLQDYGRKFTDLASSASGSPVTLELITKDYSGVEPIDLSLNPALLERQQFVISDLAKNRDDAREALATIRYVRKNSSNFQPYSAADLGAGEVAMTSYLNLQNDAAVACFQDIWGNCKLPESAFPQVNLPARRWERSGTTNASICPAGYSWFVDDNNCCRLEAKVTCAMEDGAGGCLAYKTTREKVCS